MTRDGPDQQAEEQTAVPTQKFGVIRWTGVDGRVLSCRVEAEPRLSVLGKDSRLRPRPERKRQPADGRRGGEGRVEGAIGKFKRQIKFGDR